MPTDFTLLSATGGVNFLSESLFKMELSGACRYSSMYTTHSTIWNITVTLLMFSCIRVLHFKKHHLVPT
jgi:hypothetical protein